MAAHCGHQHEATCKANCNSDELHSIEPYLSKSAVNWALRLILGRCKRGIGSMISIGLDRIAGDA